MKISIFVFTFVFSVFALAGNFFTEIQAPQNQSLDRAISVFQLLQENLVKVDQASIPVDLYRVNLKTDETPFYAIYQYANSKPILPDDRDTFRIKKLSTKEAKEEAMSLYTPNENLDDKLKVSIRRYQALKNQFSNVSRFLTLLKTMEVFKLVRENSTTKCVGLAVYNTRHNEMAVLQECSAK